MSRFRFSKSKGNSKATYFDTFNDHLILFSNIVTYTYIGRICFYCVHVNNTNGEKKSIANRIDKRLFYDHSLSKYFKNIYTLVTGDGLKMNYYYYNLLS